MCTKIDLYELDLKWDLFIGYSRHFNSRCVYRKSVVGWENLLKTVVMNDVIVISHVMSPILRPMIYNHNLHILTTFSSHMLDMFQQYIITKIWIICFRFQFRVRIKCYDLNGHFFASNYRSSYAKITRFIYPSPTTTHIIC